MSKHVPLLLTAGVALVVAMLTMVSPQRSSAAPLDADLFDGKIVTVYLDDPLTGAGQVMKDVELTEIGERWMIIGTAMPTGQPGEWDAGLKAGVAWESVTTFYVFTPEQYEQKMTKRAN